MRYASILSFLLFFSSVSCADERQSLELIQNKIEQYMLNALISTSDGTLEVHAEKPDSRLNLKACAENYLKIFNPYKSPLAQTNTLGISCEEVNNHWTLYIPVKVSIMKNILVARQLIPAGSRISENDMMQSTMNVQQLKRGYFIETKQVSGHVAKMTIHEGQPITPASIKMPTLVRKGEMVKIIAKRGGLSVNMPGQALANGAIGDTIQVKNNKSGRTIEVAVIGIKEVQVIF